MLLAEKVKWRVDGMCFLVYSYTVAGYFGLENNLFKTDPNLFVGEGILAVSMGM